MLSIESFAKINLFLNIIGRDNQGLHLLRSLFCLIPSIKDIISIDLNLSGDITITSDVLIPNNIIFKAAKFFLELTDNTRYGAHIVLKKHIPIGAGFGGGSSNVAAILIGLNTLLDSNISQEEMIKLSYKIGDDVKFFLMKLNYIMYDGYNKHEVNLSLTNPLYLLIVKPNFDMSTAEVFAMYKKHNATITPCQPQYNIYDEIIYGKNDLYEAAVLIEPRLQSIIFAIQCVGGIARMTGSGSACFGIFETQKDAKNAMIEISKHNPNWWQHLCEIGS